MQPLILDAMIVCLTVTGWKNIKSATMMFKKKCLKQSDIVFASKQIRLFLE